MFDNPFGTSSKVFVFKTGKHVENSGLFSKTTKITFHYRIKIKNHGDVTREVNVADQIPYSSNEDIVVELLELEALTNKEERRIDWNLQLKPDEEKEVNLKYSVEYPSDRRIFGL